MQADSVIIQGLEFYAYHGASDHEQTVGHRYAVDARLTVDLTAAAASDQLSDTVSYSRVAKRLVEVATASQYRLLEALAERMAAEVLTGFPLVDAVQLHVRKINPPMNAIVASVGVEIYRSRAHGTRAAS